MGNDKGVDIIIEKEGQLIPLDVKSNMKESQITKSFRIFLEKYEPEKRICLFFGVGR